MEQLLRGGKVPEINPFDCEKPVAFFPIRHHSPVCSYQLKRAIEKYAPDCILVEGPANAQRLVPVLESADTKAPVALYYFYKDKAGHLSPEKEDYKCYYPFLDFSPELVALREAGKRGIPGQFMDLSYGEILLCTKEGRGIRKETEKQTYNDDYLLSRSRYLALLCEKTGMRDFEELWEKYFEIGGLYETVEDFVRQMFAYCYLSRVHTPKEELLEDGCLERERFMAQQIAEASGKYHRILAVTGGFHTYGLMELLEADAEGKGCRFIGKKVKLSNKIEEKNQGVYPLAYSMEAADALNGYASGMPAPGFYQMIWEGLETGEEPKRIYEDAALRQLLGTGRRARQKGEGISSYDTICAFSMAKGLAALRGKRASGLYELEDAVLASYVKGEVSLSTDLPLRILRELNTGKQVGELGETKERPPLLSDFEAQCKRFGIQIQSSAEKEVTLEPFTKKKHREMSRFFFQMEFLETQFAKRKKGSDLLNKRDRNRIREIWSYRFSGQVLAALIDVSMAGSTVEEAAKARFAAQCRKSTGCREMARLMVQGFLMGFWAEQGNLGIHMRETVVADGDFFSLAEGFSYLKMLCELQELYGMGNAAKPGGEAEAADGKEPGGEEKAAVGKEPGGEVKAADGKKPGGEVKAADGKEPGGEAKAADGKQAASGAEELLEICFGKIVQLLPSMSNVSEERLTECMNCCRELYQTTGRRGYERFRPVLMGAFERLAAKENVGSGILGTVLGLLYGWDGQYGNRIQTVAEGFLKGSGEMRKKSASFLRGLFYTARDFVFVKEEFLIMVDALLAELSAEEFLELLPEFRRAFGYFTPLETDRIAGKAAALHGIGAERLLRGRKVSPLEYEYGELLDAYAGAGQETEYWG